MERIQQILDEDEQILWTGRPHEKALIPVYTFIRFFFGISSAIYAGIFVVFLFFCYYVAIENAPINSFWQTCLFIAFIVYISAPTPIEVIFLVLFVFLYMHRRFVNVKYVLTSKRTILLAPKIKHWDLTRSGEVTVGQDFGYLELEKIIEIKIVHPVGEHLRDHTLKAQDVIMKHFGKFNQKWDFTFYQIKDVEKLVKVITENFGFQIDWEKKMELYFKK